jgi:glycosyltransferase involved in cell wall biosynthesis
MKIAHVTQFFHPEMGYQENNISVIEKNKGHDVRIICINDLMNWGLLDTSKIFNMDKKFELKHDIPIVRLDYHFSFSSRFFQKGLKKALKSFNPDLLFIHGVSLPISLTTMKWGSKNNKIVFVDDHMVKAGSKNKYSQLFYTFFKPFFLIWRRVTNVRVDQWIGVSEETKEFMRTNYGIRDKINIVPLGYNDELVYYDQEGSVKWMKKNGLSKGKKYILYIGKIDAKKDPIFILNAFKKFNKENADYSLLLVGDVNKDYSKLLEDRIIELNISNEVVILNSVPNEEIRFVFSSVEMVIWPFGSSMAMLEAMACQCPVIASEMPVNRERLSNGRGVMFLRDNDLDLLSKMNEVILCKSDITSLAFAWVKNYSWKSHENRIMTNIN